VVQNSRVSAKSESDEYLLYFFPRSRCVSRSEQFPLPQKISSKFVFLIMLFTKKTAWEWVQRAYASTLVLTLFLFRSRTVSRSANLINEYLSTSTKSFKENSTYQ
jgi:hypothetical protein